MREDASIEVMDSTRVEWLIGNLFFRILPHGCDDNPNRLSDETEREFPKGRNERSLLPKIQICSCESHFPFPRCFIAH